MMKSGDTHQDINVAVASATLVDRTLIAYINMGEISVLKIEIIQN